MQAIKKQIGISTYNTELLTGILPPDIKAQIGKIKAVSITFAPIILPTEIEDSFFTIAVIVVTNSGKERIFNFCW